MRYAKIVFLLCTFAFVGNASALERRYLAAMEESQWQLTENKLTSCRIEHDIPRFGKISFVQEPARGLKLELTSRQQFKQGINVELRSETGHWNDYKTRVVLARFETRGGNSLFDIPTSIAEQAFDELSQGFQPGFLFYDDYPLIASISTVRFGNIREDFSRCVASLHRHNFDDIRVTSILFGADQEFPSIEQEETAFRRMFEYLEVDSSISDIVITGHADRTGNACYNEDLSRRRAQYVYDLLVSLGLEARILRLNSVGEHSPKKKGSSKQSLAANRRVTVELRR